MPNPPPVFPPRSCSFGRTPTVTGAILGALGLAAIGHAQTLVVSYDFENSTLSPTSLASNLSAGDVGTGPGILYYAAGSLAFTHAPGGSASEAGWYMDYPNSTPQMRTDAANAIDWAGALAADDYATFSLTVDHSYTLSLAAISFAGGFKTYAGYHAGYALYSSVTGFAGSPLGSGSAANPGAVGWTSITADVSPIAALQMLGEGTYEFRIYFADDYSYNDYTGYLYLDNIQFNGTVSAIPEPATHAVLAGLSALGLAAWRRRVRRAQRVRG